MAKSGENFITMERLVDHGFDPLVYRFFSFSAHYRSELNFSWAALDGARTALNRVYRLKSVPEIYNANELRESALAIEKALFDDLNVPRALAILHEAHSFALWKQFDSILGLDVEQNAERLIAKTGVPREIRKLSDDRSEARKAGDWIVADQLRKQIEEAGYEVLDGIEKSDIRAL
jgi:cysteinyl-tRNA synthetase